jgi:hypothetical protein
MHEDQYLPILTPHRAIAQVLRIYLPEEVEIDDQLELAIKIDSQRVNARELSAYLETIDRVYGSLVAHDLRSYARQHEAQLVITSFHTSSLEIIIRELASNSELIAALIVIRLFLKYLPGGLKDLGSAYRELEEASFTRIRRKQLAEQINADKELDKLDDAGKQNITTFLEALYKHERLLLPRAQRFTLRHVQDIKISFRKAQLRQALEFIESGDNHRAVMEAYREFESRLRTEVNNILRHIPREDFRHPETGADLSIRELIARAMEFRILPEGLNKVLMEIVNVRNFAAHQLERIDKVTAKELISRVELVLDILNRSKLDE